MITVRFTEVGREKKSWDDTFTPDEQGLLDEKDLERSVRKHARIMSHDIEFTDEGFIFVGMVRQIGKWEIIDVPT